MKPLFLFLSFAVLAGSCRISQYKRKDFSYTEGEKMYTIPVIVPRGYARQQTQVESSGNTVTRYFYGEAQFYVAHMADTGSRVNPFREEEHIPRLAPATGALVYKGLDSLNQYWREVRQKSLWMGYRRVPKHLEARFDSATNYALDHRLQ